MPLVLHRIHQSLVMLIGWHLGIYLPKIGYKMRLMTKAIRRSSLVLLLLVIARVLLSLLGLLSLYPFGSIGLGLLEASDEVGV